jgi:hypothetical protein
VLWLDRGAASKPADHATALGAATSFVSPPPDLRGLPLRETDDERLVIPPRRAAKETTKSYLRTSSLSTSRYDFG